MKVHMIKKGLQMIAVMGLILPVLCCPILAKAQGDAVLPSGMETKEAVSAIDQLLNASSDDGMAVSGGGAVRLSVNQESIYSSDFGFANQESEVLVTDETVFEWGNASQLLIWVSVLQLEEDGVIDIHENISKYLPEGTLKEQLEPCGITMEHLMNYSSGLQDNFHEKIATQGNNYSDLQTTLENTIPKQVYGAGTVVSQSEWPCALAAYIVEYMAGMSYADYVKANIFEPMDMEHTALLPDLSDNEWVMNARSNVKSYQGNMVINNNFYPIPLYPAGMVTGTMNDFHTFANELLVQDSASKLFDKTETAETLFDATMFYTGSEEGRIANGMFIYRLGKPVYGMQGYSLTQTVLIYMEPESKTCVTYMSNQSIDNERTASLTELIFGKENLEMQEEISGLRVYEGTYVAGNAIVKGKARFTSVMGAMFLTLDDDKRLVMPMLGNEPMFSVADEEHIISNNGIIGRIHAYADGTTVIMLPNQDYVSYSTFRYFGQIITFVIMLAGYCYSFFALAVGVFQWIMQKISKEEGDTCKFKKYHLIQSLNITVFGIFFAYSSMMTMSYAPASLLQTSSMVYWLGSVMSLIYIMFFWKAGRQSNVTKNKILYWTTAVFALNTILFSALFDLIF